VQLVYVVAKLYAELFEKEEKNSGRGERRELQISVAGRRSLARVIGRSSSGRLSSTWARTSSVWRSRD